MITYEEFLNTVYYTEKKVVLPLLNIRLEKSKYYTKGKYDQDKVNKHIQQLFNEYYNDDE